MQTTLLGLGIAIILALLAALIGPYFVNWNDHRAFFEAEASRLVMLEDGLWEADARVELDELAEAVDRRLASDEDEVDTLGGLIFLLAGRIPRSGEFVVHPTRWRLEAVDADPRRILRVRLHAPEAAAPAD